MSFIVDIITAPIDFIGGIIGEIPLIGPPIAGLIELPADIIEGIFADPVQIIGQIAGPLLGVPEGALQLLPGAPGFPGAGQPVDVATVVRSAAEVALRLTGIHGAISGDVGGRLEILSGHQRSVVNLLAEVFGPNAQEQTRALVALGQVALENIFPELAQSRAMQDIFLGQVFPHVGVAVGRQARYSGVRKDTVQVAARRKWVPPE